MANETHSSRREFLGALGLGVVAGAGIAPGEAAAQAAAPTRIVDFHNHYMGPSWTLTNLNGLPPKARTAWEKINANLQSPDALLGSVETASITARVINTPTAFIEDADGKYPAEAIRRINDQMAELVDKHAGKLYGLATIDAFAGDAGATELTGRCASCVCAASSWKARKAISCWATRRRARRWPPRPRSTCRCSSIR